jgi:hypothetical protein
MNISRRSRIASLAFAAGAAPLLLALTLPAWPSAPSSPGHDAPLLETPQQVADTLDSIVQPRFQKNAGRFGVDRVLLEGHDNAYGLAGENGGERRKFRQVNGAHRPYVVAFLHCAHKPGQYVPGGRRGDGETDPEVQVLATATATEDGTNNLWDWADAHLDQVVLPALAQLRRGDGVDKDFGNWRVVMRPVRAWQPACLGCHAGARRGDTLGVMVYAVDKNTIRLPVKSTTEGAR